MSSIQKIAKNTSLLMGSEIIGFILSFFFLMYTTRYLGSYSYGILSFSIALSSITIFFTDLGIGSVIIRDIARDRQLTGKYFGSSIMIKIILAIMTLVGTAVVGYVFDYPSSTMNIVYIITISLIFVSFSDIVRSIFQAFELMEYVAIGSVIYNLTMLMCAIMAIYMGFNVNGFAFVYLISSIILVGYYSFASTKRIPFPKFRVDFAFW